MKTQYMDGYRQFREKYASGEETVMRSLAQKGQSPHAMVIACSDSRVDPALLLQCDPGDLFVVRNVANIVPPYERDGGYHGTSAAMEFGICYLKVKELILLGHSQCGGIQALRKPESLHQDDFISKWVSTLRSEDMPTEIDRCAQEGLLQSYQHCLTFPWIKSRIDSGELELKLWFFNIQDATILQYDFSRKAFYALG